MWYDSGMDGSMSATYVLLAHLDEGVEEAEAEEQLLKLCRACAPIKVLGVVDLKGEGCHWWGGGPR